MTTHNQSVFPSRLQYIGLVSIIHTGTYTNIGDGHIFLFNIVTRGNHKTSNPSDRMIEKNKTGK